MDQRLPATPLLLSGHTWHARQAVRAHAFRYGLYGLLIPMRSTAGRAFRFLLGAVSFSPKDHGLGTDSAVPWLDDLLRTHASDLDTSGEVWLQTLPRVLGYAFKPVSFWFCTDCKAVVTAVVVEVNNTFGERHIYLVKGKADGSLMHARKVFHVSPFFDTQGDYEFKFAFDAQTPSSSESWVTLTKPEGAQIQTYWSGQTKPLTPTAAWQAFWRYPLQSFGVVAKIHWQAFKLWAKGVPFFTKPQPPTEFVSV